MVAYIIGLLMTWPQNKIKLPEFDFSKTYLANVIALSVKYAFNAFYVWSDFFFPYLIMVVTRLLTFSKSSFPEYKRSTRKSRSMIDFISLEF